MAWGKSENIPDAEDNSQPADNAIHRYNVSTGYRCQSPAGPSCLMIRAGEA